MTDVQRDIGALEARMNAVEARLEKIETKLDQLVEFMANAKGGWVTLVAVGSIAATIGAAIAKLIEWKVP